MTKCLSVPAGQKPGDVHRRPKTSAQMVSCDLQWGITGLGHRDRPPGSTGHWVSRVRGECPRAAGAAAKLFMGKEVCLSGRRRYGGSVKSAFILLKEFRFAILRSYNNFLTCFVSIGRFYPQLPSICTFWGFDKLSRAPPQGPSEFQC